MASLLDQLKHIAFNPNSSNNVQSLILKQCGNEKYNNPLPTRPPSVPFQESHSQPGLATTNSKWFSYPLPMLLKITYEMLYFEVFGRHKRQRVCFMFLRPDSTLFWKFYTCLRTLIAMPANCSTKLTRHDFNLFSQCLSLIFLLQIFLFICLFCCLLYVA